MKLTIENGEDTTITDVRHVSITDTEQIVFTWWERTDGSMNKYEEQQRKPRRIVLEFEDEASVNYGQVRR